MDLNIDNLLSWLRECEAEALAALWTAADQERRRWVGCQVHLRGLIEISNWCQRSCFYCGLRVENDAADRYRMTAAEIFQAAHTAKRLGYGSVVLQSGEDPDLDIAGMCSIIRQIKRETALAVTLSFGELQPDELTRLRAAGADRYLLRFETSNRRLFELIHPASADRDSPTRLELLVMLRELGFEVGSGVMVGIPGQSYGDLACDLDLCRALDLDMIGIGPYVPHPHTPLAQGEEKRRHETSDQAPADAVTTCKMIALARLICPRANIPSTTALATIGGSSGRMLGLQRGANVVMPNLTPSPYRESYTIYPNKAGTSDGPAESDAAVRQQIAQLGRSVGCGAGDSPNVRLRRAAEAEQRDLQTAEWNIPRAAGMAVGITCTSSR
jgi:biotin synthase